jgi:hypothetical protein
MKIDWDLIVAVLGFCILATLICEPAGGQQ